MPNFLLIGLWEWEGEKNPSGFSFSFYKRTAQLRTLCFYKVHTQLNSRRSWTTSSFYSRAGCVLALAGVLTNITCFSYFFSGKPKENGCLGHHARSATNNQKLCFDKHQNAMFEMYHQLFYYSVWIETLVEGKVMMVITKKSVTTRSPKDNWVERRRFFASKHTVIVSEALTPPPS